MDARKRFESYRKLEPEHRLDKAMVKKLDTRRNRWLGAFETKAASIAEDRKRVRYMREALANLADPDGEETGVEDLLRDLNGDVTDLMNRLTAACDSEKHCASLASSQAMRSLRMSRIGEVLRTFAAYDDSDIVVFTVLNENWVFSPEELLNTSARKLKLKFQRHLRAAGVADIEGRLEAFPHGEFEPVSGKFTLHFHGITLRQKYTAMLKGLSGRWGYVKSASEAAPIRLEQVHNRESQFSYLLKSYWPLKRIEVTGGKPRRDRKPERITEPFASIALVWLDRQSITDVTVVTGGGTMPCAE